MILKKISHLGCVGNSVTLGVGRKGLDHDKSDCHGRSHFQCWKVQGGVDLPTDTEISASKSVSVEVPIPKIMVGNVRVIVVG